MRSRPGSKGYWLDKDGYKIISVNGKPVREHRWVYGQYHQVELTRKQIIHHMNGDKTDNRIENLELVNGHFNHIKKHHDYVSPKEARKIVKQFFENCKKGTIKEFESTMDICVETITRKLGNWGPLKEQFLKP